MLRILRVTRIDPSAVTGAHHAFRMSLMITAVRCAVVYLAIPILVPLVSVAGVISGPLSVALCVLALVNGVIGMRRFWRADHRAKWTYTWFTTAVFVVLFASLISEISGLIAQ